MENGVPRGGALVLNLAQSSNACSPLEIGVDTKDAKDTQDRQVNEGRRGSEGT
jgi:hypothetical protein